MPSFTTLTEEINKDLTSSRHLSDGVNVKCAEERQVEGHMQDRTQDGVSYGNYGAHSPASPSYSCLAQMRWSSSASSLSRRSVLP